MKLPFTIYDLRSAIWKKSEGLPVAGCRANGGVNRQSSIVNHKSQRGIALIITLILLSVTLIMAVAFLALSRRERGAVTTTTDTATARLAADAGLANAEAEIIANALTGGGINTNNGQPIPNPYSFGLLVSTNYLPQPTVPPNLLADLTNLFYSPRVPVMMTNLVTGQYENRFYLDLNRNGRFDTNGVVGVFDANGISLGNAFEVGDPEWIGVLERPDAPHGPNNQFLARYAFIAVPAGNALDLNAIHNQTYDTATGNRAVNPPPGGNGEDIFFRNQGVGSWEINLAAFLADLNTNGWGQIVGSGSSAPVGSANFYDYNEPVSYNSGNAFDDARALLAFRYANTYNLLAPVGGTIPSGLFTNSTTTFPPFQNNIDAYSDGPLMTNLAGISLIGQDITLPWAGADNTNHFYDLTADLFDPTKSSTAFTNHLQQAGTGNSTYDRYTFYRLLSQMGTDSDPESGKMNLNYDNIDRGLNGALNVNGTSSETNFVPWTTTNFFFNAADRMLRLYTTNWLAENYTIYTNTFGTSVTNAFGVTDIPVWVDGRFVYTPAVNRILQLAANIYDANYYKNHFFPISGSVSTPYLPSVFQPMFYVTNGNVYITNFVEVVDTNLLAYPLLNLGYGPSVITTLQSQPHDLVFGVPLIIGAKKGFPNFNEFAMQSGFQLTRKLQVTRTSPTALANTYKINQMFMLGVTNQLGVECWNSYAENYDRPIDIYANDYITMMLTNDSAGAIASGATVVSGSISIPPGSFWPGYNISSPGNSFQIPLNTNIAFVPTSMYRFDDPNYPNHLSTNLSLPYETGVTGYPQPNWGLITTNNIQVFMVDTMSSPNRIIDYVQLGGPNSSRNLSAEIQNENDTGNLEGYNGLWLTNLNNQGEPYGIVNQVDIALGIDGLNGGLNGWTQTDTNSVENAIDGFRVFYHLSPIYDNPGSNTGIDSSTNNIQVAYTPTAITYQHTTWQANDPLVHYLASDLNTPVGNYIDSNPNWPGNLGLLNDRYMPWGGNPMLPSADQNPYSLSIKDPLVYSSDSWNFPTNTFPTVGWLGRVHRGTPWQTVYLKSPDVLAANGGITTWTNWSGDINQFDATNTAPAWDRLLFDVFTTAPNDNATRGQLSINVGAPNGPNLAAWSALFSGIVVPPPSITNGYSVIQPVGASAVPVPAASPGPNSPLDLAYLLENGTNGINDIRAKLVYADGLSNVFEHVGDILAVPALTVQSPFLNLANTNYNNDAMYEWLPQQIMSLVRVENAPRYVIYSFGQTLKPAPGSVVTSGGPFFQMVTNYQVVAETATRAVVRVENPPTPQNTNASPHIVLESFNILPPD